MGQNRLIKEKSPYLLEHAHNPVDWYPWGDEAFEKARKEDKPVFLSIGYSACHWCHVLRKESFEDPAIARILNENFVSIKVDREERPDVDEIYMKAVQSMTGSGGWPLSVFLTPTLEPFYGGTYFPPTTRYGMPGFSTILRGVAESWRNERGKIHQSAAEIKQALIEVYAEKSGESPETVGDYVLDLAFTELSSSFDREYGGFGIAPKFPSPSTLFFLLRYSKRINSNGPLIMVKKTLDSMARGGIYDHLGGGFHRYSTDKEWLVPHFEKMLYDNALLSQVFTEAYLVTKNEGYKRVVYETLDWIKREMTSREGGFFSSHDADTSEGEGVYYSWTPEDVRAALSQAGWDESTLDSEMDLIIQYYGITKEGNFENARSILTLSDERTAKLERDHKEFKTTIANSRLAMIEFRGKRPTPLLDDKILTSWNGLAISAFARAFQAFGEEQFLLDAKRSADFLLSTLAKKNDKGRIATLKHRFRDGEVAGEGLLEDYAYFIEGLLDLYESDFDSSYLRAAIDLSETMVRSFYDQNAGGFFLSDAKSSDLLTRPKEAYDGALPSANSVATMALFRLGEMTSRRDFEDLAMNTVKIFYSRIESQPSAFAFMLCALNFRLSGPKAIVFSAEKNSPTLASILRVLRDQYYPNSILLLASKETSQLSPLAEGRVPRPGETARAFVCENNTCKLPATSPSQFAEALAS